MMRARRPFLLGAVFSAALLGLDPAAGAAPPPAGYDAWVDLTAGTLRLRGQEKPVRSENRCRLMQRALAPALILGQQRLPWRVRIEGRALIRMADHKRYRKPEERICIAFFGGPDADGDGYPEDFAGEPTPRGTLHALQLAGRLHVSWDADLRIDTTGQKVESNFIQLGDTARVGWLEAGRGGLSNLVSMPVMSGRLSVTLVGKADPGWPAGRIPDVRSTAPYGSPTSYVVWSEEGLLRADFSGLVRFFSGNGRDRDDIGILHRIYGWIQQNGPIYVTRFAVGLYSVGNWVGATRGGMLERNSYNVVFGDPYDGAAMKPVAQCLKGGAFCAPVVNENAAHALRDLTVEGSWYSNLLVFSGRRLLFDNVWFEYDKASKGHSVVLGAGLSERTKLPCGLDGDAPGEKCLAVPAAPPVGARFVGGLIGGDKGSLQRDALVLGPGAGPGSTVFIQGALRGSRVRTPLGSRRWLFVAHPKARAFMDLQAADPESAGKLPDYPYLAAPRSLEAKPRKAGSAP